MTPGRMYRSPFQILIIIALSIFISETLVMILISKLPPLSMMVEAFLDASLLVILVSPMLYFFLFNPLILHIADRKKAEEELAESAKKYRMLIENIQDGVIIIQDSRIQFANDAFAMVAGYTVEEVVGRDFWEFVAPEDLEMVRDRYHRAGESVPRGYEFRVLHRDGKKRITINVNGGIITYRGRVASMGTVKDIAEQQEKEKIEVQLLQSDKPVTIAAAVSQAELERYPKILDSDIIKAISNPIRKDIVKQLDKAGKLKFSDIKNILKIDDGTKLSFHLRVLKSYNVIEQNGEKTYMMTPVGRKLMENLKRVDGMA
ncbi:MAG TPA: PAS domain S-box protein [candidate division Zixibacteria bacterium]|nr:PAS domain S-box protein [candidate division Zixibacteria bacterium]